MRDGKEVADAGATEAANGAKTAKGFDDDSDTSSSSDDEDDEKDEAGGGIPAPSSTSAPAAEAPAQATMAPAPATTAPAPSTSASAPPQSPSPAVSRSSSTAARVQSESVHGGSAQGNSVHNGSVHGGSVHGGSTQAGGGGAQGGKGVVEHVLATFLLSDEATQVLRTDQHPATCAGLHRQRNERGHLGGGLRHASPGERTPARTPFRTPARTPSAAVRDLDAQSARRSDSVGNTRPHGTRPPHSAAAREGPSSPPSFTQRAAWQVSPTRRMGSTPQTASERLAAARSAGGAAGAYPEREEAISFEAYLTMKAMCKRGHASNPHVLCMRLLRSRWLVACMRLQNQRPHLFIRSQLVCVQT